MSHMSMVNVQVSSFSSHLLDMLFADHGPLKVLFALAFTIGNG